MKMMVKLTVLLATLLLLTGVSFAIELDCYCYSVTCTNLDNGTVIGDHPVEMCFNYEDQIGTFDGFCNTDGSGVSEHFIESTDRNDQYWLDRYLYPDYYGALYFNGKGNLPV